MKRLGIFVVLAVLLVSSYAHAEIIPLESDTMPEPNNSTQQQDYPVGQIKSFWFETLIGIGVIAGVCWYVWYQAKGKDKD